MSLATERTRLAPEALHALVTAPGPWVSAYIGLSDRQPQGRRVERSARWHALATGLLDDGAPADVVASIGGAVHPEPPGPAVLAAFTHAGRAVTLFRVPHLGTPDTADVGPLPAVLPLLGWLQDHPPHVVVVTDRTGADIEAVASPIPSVDRRRPGRRDRAQCTRRLGAGPLPAPRRGLLGTQRRLRRRGGYYGNARDRRPAGGRCRRRARRPGWRRSSQRAGASRSPGDTSPAAVARTAHNAPGPSASTKRCRMSGTRRSSHCSAASLRSARLEVSAWRGCRRPSTHSLGATWLRCSWCPRARRQHGLLRSPSRTRAGRGRRAAAVRLGSGGSGAAGRRRRPRRARYPRPGLARAGRAARQPRGRHRRLLPLPLKGPVRGLGKSRDVALPPATRRSIAHKPSRFLGRGLSRRRARGSLAHRYEMRSRARRQRRSPIHGCAPPRRTQGRMRADPFAGRGQRSRGACMAGSGAWSVLTSCQGSQGT